MFIIVLLVITVIIPLLRSLHLPQCWRRRCYYRMYPLLRGRALHPEQEVVLCLRSGRRRDRSSHRLPYHQRLPCRAWRRPVHYSRSCRSEEHTSELQSLMRISYAVFCLKKKTYNTNGRPPSTNNTIRY